MKRGRGTGRRGGRRTRRAFLAALAGAIFAAGSWLGLRWWKSHPPARVPRPGSAGTPERDLARGSLYEPHDLAG